MVVCELARLAVEWLLPGTVAAARMARPRTLRRRFVGFMADCAQGWKYLTVDMVEWRKK